MSFFKRRKVDSPPREVVLHPVGSMTGSQEAEFRRVNGLAPIQAPPHNAREAADRVIEAMLHGDLVPNTQVSQIHAEISGLRSEAQRQAENGDKLNRAFGEFREREIQPLREELKSLRYNMGAKVEQTTTELAAFVGRLDGIVDMLLMAQGWGPERIADYKVQHGLDSTQAPRAAEFAAYAEQQAELKGQLQALTESNQRLAEQNERLLTRLRAKKRKRRSG